MPETSWGRKETIIWPPHSPICTFGAVFLALILTGLFVYLRFAFALSTLEQFYLPLYIKTSIAPSSRSSGKYQMLLISDPKARDALYAGRKPPTFEKPVRWSVSQSISTMIFCLPNRGDTCWCSCAFSPQTLD